MTRTSEETISAAGATRQRRLFLWLFLVNTVLLSCYAAFIVIFVPNQVQTLDPMQKVGNLAIVTTSASIATIFIQPLVGAFSDRTRSRLGRRAPWVLIGAGGAAVFMLLLAGAATLLWITIFYVMVMILLNTLNAPIPAIITDRVPTRSRGVASAVLAMGTLVGMGAGVIGAGYFAEMIGVGYGVFAALVLLSAFGFVLFNRDFSSKDAERTPFYWRAFLAGFWVSPRRYPDFAWAFAARFLMILAYQGVQSYLLYILRDHIHMSVEASNSFAGILTVVQLLAALISTYASGKLSDRLHRRKPFVIGASLIMGCALAIPLLWPTQAGMIALAALFGFGYGVYLSVDLALMTEVLPAEGISTGRDMGILNVATTLPQALTPLVAWALIALTGGYSSIFVAGIGFALLGAVAVVPIRGAR
ncbi:MFS transporter [Leifsonia sp. 21MFCrub1.1]|uniref:MFS transporter n=1 Tax=Leifsonia sp. 21MFCrub1.1 TaxID=1798223 RepID=UPI0008928B94|nr:MFS transporter [Leifsonia sp. 21MFCrub1.1]SEB07886.1 Na+/melibiose symporter [Leifsonia sp. 21MFCrub1.1]